MSSPRLLSRSFVTFSLAWVVATAIACDGTAATPDGNAAPSGSANTALEEAFLSGYAVITGETAADGASSKQLQVTCPAGKRALGAGWAVLDPTSTILSGAATYSAPSWDGTSWLVSAKNLSSFAPTWKLQVRVTCANAAGLPGYEVVPVETALDSTASKQLQLSCPTGKKALGAGWGVLDGTSAILEGKTTYFAPSWDGASWLMNARNQSTYASAWKLKGQLICATVGTGSTYALVTHETAVNTTGSKQLSATCPTGKHALGTGWGTLDGTSAILDGAALYFQPGYDGSGWLTNAQLSTASPSTGWKLWTRMICG